MASRSTLERLARALAEQRKRQLKTEFATRGYRDEDGIWRGGLMSFVRIFWRVLEPETPMVDGWAMEAICEHLEAVSYGDLTRVLINVPPGFCKSLITNVFFPAWEWSARGMPHLRYITFSYSSRLTERDNVRFRDLLMSAEFRSFYADVFRLTKIGDQKISNNNMGWKIASSVGGVGTGERADRILGDDLHNVKEAESDVVRTATVQWFRESMSNRLNDPELSAIILIMQRVNEDDVPGVILSLGLPYCHLMIPMEYDPDRQFDDAGNIMRTDIGWLDPRFDADDIEGCRDLLAWPQRFPASVVKTMKAEMGPYAWAAQYAQSPGPRGGGLFQKVWWQVWESPDGRSFPPLEYVVASLDSAFTEKQENDPSALTIWGVFKNEQGNRRIILVNAWRKRLRFHGPAIEQKPREDYKAFVMRASPHWGLVEWAAYSCNRFKVDRLLIEAKASGISVAQELQRQHGREGWAVELINPKGDKVARAHAVVATLAQGMVYAPIRDWADMVIQECSVFPKGTTDDLVDSTTMALSHLRSIGLAQSDEEEQYEVNEALRHQPQARPLYPV